jgi:outer membrane protein assembly factor BamA
MSIFKQTFATHLTSLIVLLVLFICSCSPTKTLTQNQYLLNKTKLKTKLHSLDRDEVNAIVKQKPNKKLFGFFRFYLLAYNFSKSGKQNRFKRWIDSTIAEEPVIYDSILTQRTISQLQLYLIKKGYFKSIVKDSVILKNKKATIIYELIGNTQFTFNKIDYDIKDETIRRLIFSDTSKSNIKTGQAFDQTNIELERDRLTYLIRNNGYFGFTKDYIKLLADSSNKTHSIHASLIINNPETKSQHERYLVKDILLYTNFLLTKRNEIFSDTLLYKDHYKFIFNKKIDYKKEILLRPIFFEPDHNFSQSNVEETYKQYQNLKIFSNVNLEFIDVSDSVGKKVNAIIRLSPLKRQTYSIESEGTNSSGYFGIRGNLVYQNKNIFKGAEIFQIKTGLELKQLPNIVTDNQNTAEQIKNYTFNTIEIGPELSLTIPRFSFPYISSRISKRAYPKTIISTAFNYQSNNNYTRTIANISFTYSWREGKFKTHTVTPIELNSIGIVQSDAFKKLLEERNNPLLTQSYQKLLITAFKYSFVFNNQESFKKFHYTYLKITAESAGNIPQLINNSRGAVKILNEDKETYSYTIFKGTPTIKALSQPYAQYGKLEIDYRSYFNFSGSRKFVIRLDVGYAKAYGNSTSIPFVKSFIGGGTNDIRAWRARTLGPGNYQNFDASALEKIGDIKFVGNFEFRYKVYKKLNAATFIDCGNIWLNNPDSKTGKIGAQFQLKNCLNSFAVGGGFGLRYDFTFFIFRLDIAAKLRNPEREEGERWVVLTKDFLNINNFNFLNIGIGYPF